MKEKKRVYDGIAFVFVNQHSRGASAERLTKIPAQNSQFQCPVTWSTIVVESHCESSMAFLDSVSHGKSKIRLPALQRIVMPTEILCCHSYCNFPR